MDVTQTNESGVQTDSGPETRSFGSQASTRMASSSALTMHRESRATEDRSDEIARLQAIHEQKTVLDKLTSCKYRRCKKPVNENK